MGTEEQNGGSAVIPAPQRPPPVSSVDWSLYRSRIEASLQKEGLPHDAASRMFFKFSTTVVRFMQDVSQLEGYESLSRRSGGVTLDRNHLEGGGAARSEGFFINPLDAQMKTTSEAEKRTPKTVAENLLLAMQIEAVRTTFRDPAAADEERYWEKLAPLSDALRKNGTRERILGELVSTLLSYGKVYNVASQAYAGRDTEASFEDRKGRLSKFSARTRSKAVSSYEQKQLARLQTPAANADKERGGAERD